MMSTYRVRYAVLVFGVSLLACGDSDSANDASLPGDAAPPDAALIDAPPPPCPDDIGGAVGMACSLDGQSCGGPCSDPCSFCNIIRCSTGMWQPVEVFPIPCFDCGDSLRCSELSAYCHLQRSDVAGMPDVFECRMLPDACANNATCACLEAEIPVDQCTEGTEGGITVESAGG